MLFKRGSSRGTSHAQFKPRFYKRRWFQILLGGALTVGIVGLVAAYLFLKPRRDRAYSDFDLAAVYELELPSRIYDRHGNEIGQIKIEDRRPVPIDQIPYHVIQALTAVEDSRYFQHGGVDYIGIARAVVLNFKAGRVTQGASTITQQLAKQAFPILRDERNIDNKITEAFLARRLEQHFTKSQILEHYFNRVFFGSGYFGIEAASRGYFGKSVSGLDVVEAATLCGLIKSPTRLSPKNNPRESREARNHALRRMHAEEMISDAQLAEYLARPIELADKQETQNSYVNEMIRLQVIDLTGFELAGTGGFKIYTTIDRDVQASTERSLQRHLAKVESNSEFKHRTYQQYREARNLGSAQDSENSPDYLQGAALMIENRTGGIVAMVGGRDFGDSQYNRALQARRPTGTAFIPFVYATAFAENNFPGSIIKDAPIDNRSVAIGGSTGILGEWGAESDTVSYLGDIPAREALVQSKNAATVRLGKELGRDKVVALAKRAGIESPMDEYDRTLLGTSGATMGEMVRAFTIFPNGGKHPKDVHIISSISDGNGTSFFSEPETELIEACDHIASYQVHSCLAESLKRGTAKAAAKSFGLTDINAAGKTGTAYDFTDLWFIGYNNQVTCGVWMGFDTPKTIYRGAFSNTSALPVWVDSLNASLGAFPSEPVPYPDGAQTIEICKKSGRRATDACYKEIADAADGSPRIERSTYKEIIRAGTHFDAYCDYHKGGGERFRPPTLPQFASTTPGGSSPLTPASSAGSILVRSPAVIGGFDPYDSIQPALRARPAGETEEIRRATPVSPISLDRTESPIELSRPKPLEIPEID